MLIENTLFGEVDKVQEAIERLRAFAPAALENNPNGYVVCDSGGKDSTVIKKLAHLAGVPFEIVHNHTTADYPQTVYHVREEQQRWRELGVEYNIRYPIYKGRRTTMWELIVLKGPPTRIKRWCCEYLKKQANRGRFIVTGVRWEESVRRKNNRAMFEIPKTSKERHKVNNAEKALEVLAAATLRKNEVNVNPIIDWTLTDVWDFIHFYELPYNPLYDMGFLRVGCCGCPMGDNKKELEEYPAFKKLYLRAFDKCVASKPLARYGWLTGQDLYDWWVSKNRVKQDDGQMSLWDEECPYYSA